MYQSRIRNKKRSRQNKKLEFVEVGEDQQYAIVQDLLGNGRVRLFCEDKKLRVGRIRGSLRKFTNKAIVERGDLVIISFRDFGADAVVSASDTSVDILHKYTAEDTASLVRYESLPEEIHKKITGCDATEGRGHNDDTVVFMDEAAHERHQTGIQGGAGADGGGDGDNDSERDGDAEGDSDGDADAENGWAKGGFTGGEPVKTWSSCDLDIDAI